MKDIVSLPMEIPKDTVDSKYRACVIAAQRALQLIKGSKPRVETNYRKATTKALAEMSESLVSYSTGEEAEDARQKDEVLYREILSETRANYVDEEGNPVFSQGPQRVEADTPPAPTAPAPSA